MELQGSSEGRGGRGGRTLEWTSGGGQQDTRDDADASSLVLLLSAAVLSVRDKPPGSLLLIPEGAGWDEEEDGAAGEVEEGSRSRGMTWTRHLSCICSPLLFSVSATSS